MTKDDLKLRQHVMSHAAVSDVTSSITFESVASTDLSFCKVLTERRFLGKP